MYNASKRVRLLRSTVQGSFPVRLPFLLDPRFSLRPLLCTCTCTQSHRLWSYNSQVCFLVSPPFVRQATSARSDEASSRKRAENRGETDDLGLRIAHILREKPWCPLTEGELQVFLPLPSSVVHEVLHQDITIECALSFLSWACKQPSFVLDADDVNGIAQLWTSKYASFALSDLQETLNSMGSFYTEAAWAAMMTMCTFLRKPDQSVCIFMELKKHGCKPSQLSYDPFLFALVKCRRIDAALLTMQEMLTSGILPGERALGVLLDATCKAGKPKDAYDVVQDIARLCSIQFRELAYSRLITAVWRINGSMALDIINEMKVKGLQPDRHAYTVCVKLLCRNHRFDLAQRLLNDMNRHKCSPDMLTYTTMINGLYKGGKAKEALEMVELIRKEGHPLDSRMYTAFLSCLFTVGRINDAVEEFEKMQRDGHPADLVTYFVMIKNLCESGDIKRALDFKKVMNEKGFQPDARLYQALQRGLCMGSRYVDELMNLVEEMKSRGYSPSAEVYLTLVTHFCTQSKYDTARVWAKEMVDEGYKPTPYIRTKFSELHDVFED